VRQSLKRVKIEEKLLWRVYRKSPTLFRFLGRRHISTSGFASTVTRRPFFALFLPVHPSNRYQMVGYILMQCQGQPNPAKDQWCMEIKGATSPLQIDFLASNHVRIVGMCIFANAIAQLSCLRLCYDYTLRVQW